MAKTLIVIGLGLAGIGLLMMLGFPIGRLPGDLVFRRGNVSFYVPLATSILLSILLTLLLSFIRR